MHARTPILSSERRLSGEAEAETLRASLLGYARRRLPSHEAEDVVQQALCEGLASERLPASVVERSAWMMAVLKHKIADVFRERRPLQLESGAHRDIQRVTPSEQWEAREVLRNIVESARKEERETLSWLVQEHAGDPLESIARRERIEAPTLRKRVSRLRQVLRARYLLPAAALLAVVAYAAGQRDLLSPPAPEQAIIKPDLTGLRPATKISEITGTWRIEQVEPAGNVATGDQMLMTGAQRGKLEVTSARVVLTLARSHPLQVVDLADGRLRVRSSDGAVHVVSAQVAPDGSLVVEGNEGRFRGRAVLKH